MGATGATLRSKSAVGVGGVVVAVALIALAVVLADPFRATAYDLDQASVWITRDGKDVGRVNTEIAQLDNRADLAGTQDVVQDGRDVFLVDGAQRELTRIDPATFAAAEAIALPPTPRVDVRGGTLVVFSGEQGELRTGRAGDEAAVVRSEPIVAAGPDADVAVGVDGSVAVLSTDGALTVVRPDGGEPERASVALAGDVSFDPVDGSAQLAFAGRTAVVLDRSSGVVLSADGARLSLPDVTGTPQLQVHGDDPSSVLVADDATLWRIALDGGAATEVSGQGTRDAVRPVQLAGCSYGGWAGDPFEVVACDGTATVAASLAGLPQNSSIGPGAKLTFRSNGAAVALNDTANGIGFIRFGDEIRAVDNWDALDPDDPNEQTSDEQELQDMPPPDQQNRRPEPDDDLLGARPGRKTVLPVLVNDYDPDQDVLRVAEVDNSSDIPVEPVQGGGAVAIDVPASATGSVTFSYTVTDGKPDGTAQANVTVTFVSDATNNAPEPPTTTPPWKVEAGKTFSDDALKGWIDPEGDPFYLEQAVAVPPNQVRFEPTGQVEFKAGIEAQPTRIALVVSDGIDERGRGSGEIPVEIVASGTALKPVARNDVAEAFVGREVVIDLLVNDSDPNGDPLQFAEPGLDRRLVPAETTIELDRSRGAVRFQATRPGPAVFQYTVVDPSGQQSSAWVLVDVRPAPEANRPPVAIADVAALPVGGTVVVDLLGNDYDPDGDVLMVTDSAPSEDPGLTVVLEQHRYLRVMLHGAPKAKTTPITYTVSDGALSDENGVLNVVSVDPPQTNQPPVAGPDRVRVRAGDVVSIPVLNNDTDPELDEIHLRGDLAVPPTTGLAFVDRDLVRYRAPAEAGTTQFFYQVDDPWNSPVSGQVDVEIVAADTANNPPAPTDVEARAVAGEDVLIPIPLDGIDPDGDSVRLVGLDASGKPPDGVAVPADLPGFMLYRAPEGIRSDEFVYQVVDRGGLTGSARVRIVVAPSSDEVVNRDPIAVPDTFEGAPGRTMLLPVLANDVDPDGDPLGFAPATDKNPTPILVAEELRGSVSVADDGQRLKMTLPATEGVYPVTYTITDRRGGVATTIANVTVRAGAAGLAPVARDDVVAPTAEPTVEVRVLDNDEDPDGAVADLTLAVEEVDGVRAEGTVVRADLVDRPRLVSYTITDEDQNVATALIWLPARGGEVNHPPMARPDAGVIEVEAGGTRAFEIDEFVMDPDGDAFEITSPDKVRATKNANDPADPAKALYQGPTSILFIASEVNTGDGQIVFEVADRPGEPTSTKASVALRVRVKPPANAPPKLLTAILDLREGDTIRQDLLGLVKDDEPKKLEFSTPTASDPNGIDISLDGTTLVVEWDGASAESPPRQISAPVRDPEANFEGAIVVVVSIQETTAPLPSVGRDTVRTRPGVRTPVNVIDNDVPGDPDLDLIIKPDSVKKTSGEGTFSVEPDQQTIVYTPSADFVGLAEFDFVVAEEGIDRADRNQPGHLTIEVQDRPGPPMNASVVSSGNRSVRLTWLPPVKTGNNGDLRYEVSWNGAGRSFPCPSTTCDVTGLTNGDTYAFTVVALNAFNEPSPEASVAGAGKPDTPPGKPTITEVKTNGARSVAISWAAPENEGSSITSYAVRKIPAADFDARRNTWSEACDPKLSLSCSVPLGSSGAFYFQVRAVNGSPEQNWSEPVRGESFNEPPEFSLQMKVTKGHEVSVAVQTSLNEAHGEVCFTLQAPPAAGPQGSRCVRAGAAIDPWTFTIPQDTEVSVDATATNATEVVTRASATDVTYSQPDMPKKLKFVGVIGDAATDGLRAVYGDDETPLADLPCTNYGGAVCPVGFQTITYVVGGGSYPTVGALAQAMVPWSKQTVTVTICNNKDLCTSSPVDATKWTAPEAAATVLPATHANAPGCLTSLPKTCVAFELKWTPATAAHDYETFVCLGSEDVDGQAPDDCTTKSTISAAGQTVQQTVEGLPNNTYWVVFKVCDRTEPFDADGTPVCSIATKTAT